MSLPGARVMLRTRTFSGCLVGGAELGALDDRPQHDPHLVFGEGRADAAPDAAAEGDPGVGVGLGLEEALGPEALGLGEEVLAVVQGGDRRQDEGAAGELVAGDRERAGQLAGDVDDHRSRAQRLLDRRLEVVVLAGGDRAAQAVEHRPVPQQALDRPGEPGRGRLVAGAENRDQLVAELGVAHRAAVLVAGGEQQREHVVEDALPRLGDLGPAQGDLLVDEGVHRRAGAEEFPPGAEPAEVPLQDREGDHGVDAAAELLDQALEAEQALLVVDAEDRAHDHRQGDPLGVGAEGEGLADRPALHLAQGDLAHQLAVGLDPLAVEGRQQQFALAHVRGLVEGQHRARPERRLEDRRVGLSGVHLGGRPGEDLFDQLGGGDVDEPAEVREADREDVAVAALEVGEEVERVARVAHRLQGRRHPRSRGKPGECSLSRHARRRSCERRRGGRDRRGGP